MTSVRMERRAGRTADSGLLSAKEASVVWLYSCLSRSWISWNTAAESRDSSVGCRPA